MKEGARLPSAEAGRNQRSDYPQNHAYLHSGQSPPQPPKPTFASLLSSESPPLDFCIDDLQPPFIENGLLSVRISEEPYLRGLERCKTNLVGRLVLPPNASPLKSHDLMRQLSALWPSTNNWSVSPLGRGFFMLQFQSLEDMQKIWSLGSISLQQGTLRLIKWSPSFSPSTYKNTFAQVWVRLWDLGFDFWEQQTLFEIARGIGVPLKLDSRTVNRSVGLYARVLVDVDLSQALPQQLRVTRSTGQQIVIGVEFEALPTVCSNCGIVGHQSTTCRVLNVVPPLEDATVVRGRSLKRSSRWQRRNNASRKNSKQKIENGLLERKAALEKVDVAPVDLVPLEQVMTANRANTDQVCQQISDQASSFDSVPPGFQRLEPTASEVGIVSTGDITSPGDCENGKTVLEPSCYAVDPASLLIGETSNIREEGEFTPVVSKKTKKQLRKLDKPNAKVQGKKSVQGRKSVAGRALMLKGAKHKLF